MKKEFNWNVLWIIFGILFVIWFFIPDSNGGFDESYYFEINGESNPDFMFFPYYFITYSFNPENPCIGTKAARIHEAFGIIEIETEGEVFFEYEPVNEGDIIITCWDDQGEEGVAGEGGPIFYEGEREIIGGEVDFYPYLEDEIFCENYPTTELHEILHVFGFGHFYEEDSIMHEGFNEIELYEWEDDQPSVCKEIDYEIVECLKNIYSNGLNGSSCGNLPSICYKRICPVEIPKIYKP